MEHQFYIDRLSAYFDNELKNEEYVIIHEHVQSCDECQKRLQELEKLENLISAKTELSDNDYWEQSAQKIEAALDTAPKTEIVKIDKSSSSSLWWKLTGVAASLVLVALFAFEQKDKDHELLLEDSYNYSIEKKVEDSTPTSVDTFRQDVSEEPTADYLEVQKGDKQDISLASKQAVDNLVSKPQAAPQPVRLKKELSETKSLQSSNSAASPVPIKENLRMLEFDNGGVETASVPAIKQIVPDKIEKNLDKSIEVLSEDVVDELKKDNLVGEESEEIKAKDKFATSTSVAIPSYETQAGISIDTKKNDHEIEYWRRKTTEYSIQLNEQRTKKSVRYLKSATTDTTDKKSAIIHADRDLVYRQLFEAYYNIALMTPDSTEEKQAVQFLTKHAQSVENSYNIDALYYLELYKIEKNRQKPAKE